MDGYSKIRLAKGTKSRSMDISDFSIFPETPKATETTSPNHTSKTHEFKQIKSPNNTHEPPSDSVYEHGNGERFGMKLTGNSSVSSASSHKFEKQSTTTTLQSAVKRAFSMSRSSSVSERYCRIHDQCVTLASPIDDDDDIEAIDNNNEMKRRSVKKKKKKKHSSGSGSGRILKACKRLFGL